MLDGSRELFDYGGRYHIETKSMDWFLYDNGLRHERVKKCDICMLVLGAVF